MTSARTVIEWDGRDDGAVMREVQALPPGRYVLVPENELTSDAEPEDVTLTTAQIAALDEGLEQIAHGATVSRDEFVARRAARRRGSTP